MNNKKEKLAAFDAAARELAIALTKLSIAATECAAASSTALRAVQEADVPDELRAMFATINKQLQDGHAHLQSIAPAIHEIAFGGDAKGNA